METEERGAWRDYTRAGLRSFVRRYNVQASGKSPHAPRYLFSPALQPCRPAQAVCRPLRSLQ